ncbi:hypothetical protein ACR6HW_00560 [Fusibacter sp. JL298sf-3]
MKIKYAVLILAVIIAVTAFSTKEKNHFTDVVMEDIEHDTAVLLSTTQSEEVSAYLKKMNSEGFINPKFKSFYAEDERRQYILVETQNTSLGGTGFAYIVVTYDAKNTVADVLTSSWVRIGDDKKNF